MASTCSGGVDALHGVGGGQGRVAAGEVGWVCEGPACGLDDVLLSINKGWGGACQWGHECSDLFHRLLHKLHPYQGCAERNRTFTHATAATPSGPQGVCMPWNLYNVYGRVAACLARVDEVLGDVLQA